MIFLRNVRLIIDILFDGLSQRNTNTGFYPKLFVQHKPSLCGCLPNASVNHYGFKLPSVWLKCRYKRNYMLLHGTRQMSKNFLEAIMDNNKVSNIFLSKGSTICF